MSRIFLVENLEDSRLRLIRLSYLRFHKFKQFLRYIKSACFWWTLILWNENYFYFNCYNWINHFNKMFSSTLSKLTLICLAMYIVYFKFLLLLFFCLFILFNIFAFSIFATAFFRSFYKIILLGYFILLGFTYVSFINLQKSLQNRAWQWVLFKQLLYVVRCAIWHHLYNLKNVKNTHGRVFFTFFKLHKWYQIAQSITYLIDFLVDSQEY